MQTRSKLFEDLSKVASGATQSVIGLRAEIDALVRGQLSRLLADMDLVPREEFDAVRAMAQRAREENEKLEARIEALESGTKPAPAAKKAAAKKAAPKKAPAKSG